MSELETDPICPHTEIVSHPVEDEVEGGRFYNAPIPEVGHVEEANGGVVVGEDRDANERRESDPLLKLPSKKRYYKRSTILCVVALLLATLAFLIFVICFVIGNHFPTSNITKYDQYSCSGIYTRMASFGDCTMNYCDLLEIVVMAADYSKPDQVLVFLTKCSNIVHGSTNEVCADECHIKSSTRNTSLLPSNITQTCTLDVCRSNMDRGCKPASTVCTLNITKKLLSGSSGTDFCILSMGVSAGDNTCQRTNLTVQFRRNVNVLNVTGWSFVGIAAAVVIILVICFIIAKCHKEPTRPIAETVREDE